MNTIDKYLIKRFFASFFFMLMAVLVIVWVVDMVEKLEDFMNKKPGLYETIFDYYVNLLLYYGNMFAPICVFLAVIFFTSQMAQRTELVSLLSGGVSFYRVFLPYIFGAVMLAGASFVLKGFIVPHATTTRLDFEYKYTNKKRVSRDRDIHKKVAADKKTFTDTYVYMTYFDHKRKEAFGFTMEKMQRGAMIAKMKAERAIWSDSLEKWQLKDVTIRNINGEKESIQKVVKIDTTFNLKPGDIFIIEQKSETMNNAELNDYIVLEEMRGSEILEDLYIEKNRRYADPIALIILTIIGYAMSTRKSRGGTALQIGLGVVISVVYIAMLLLGTLFISDVFPAWLAVWLPNMIFFPFSLLLMRLAPK